MASVFALAASNADVESIQNRVSKFMALSPNLEYKKITFSSFAKGLKFVTIVSLTKSRTSSKSEERT
jgi:hypothetical protein